MSRLLSRLPLHGRFTLVGAVIVVLTVAAMLFLHISEMRTILAERAQARLDERAAVYSVALLGPLVQGDYAELDAIIEGLRKEAGMSYIAVFDEQGLDVAHAGVVAPQGLPPPMRDVQRALDEGAVVFHAEVPLQVGQHLYGHLRYGIDLRYFAEARARLVRDALLLGLGALVVAVLAFGLLSFLVTRQLRRLTAHSQRLAAGDYAARLEVTHQDEIGQLGQALDDLAHEVLKRVSALEFAEARLRLVMEQLPAVIWTTDAALRFTSSQGAGLASLGLKPGQVVGMGLAEFSGGDDTPVVAAHKLALFGEAQSFDDEHGGRVFSSHLKPLRNAGGHIEGVIGLALDITERQQAQAALDHQRRLYWVLSEVNESIIRTQGRYELFKGVCQTAVDSGLFRMAWVGMLDEAGETVQPYVTWGFDEGYTDHLGIRMDVPGPDAGPVVAAFRDGNEFIVQDIANDPFMVPWREEAMKREFRAMAVYPIREDGRPIGNLNVYSPFVDFFTEDVQKLMAELAADLSHAMDFMAETRRRREAEAGLRTLNAELEQRVAERTRQLAAANKELESFSYSVSHDLRSPLRSIDGFSQILLSRYHDRLDAQGQDYLHRVRRASQRMGELIDDLLQLARMSRADLRVVEVDLSRIAREVVDGLRANDPERAVEVAIELGLVAQADPGLVRVVLENLLGNAWKFTAKVAVARIEFGRGEIEGEPGFFVRDNGVGFNPEYTHKLFGAFQRLHGANEFEGTGIGLATVQRIVHRHGGRVRADSDGQGATFTFSLGTQT